MRERRPIEPGAALRHDSGFMARHSLLRRMRADFRLTIITLFGLSAMLGILPFALFRFLHGDVVTGAGDCALIAFIGGLVVYAWRSGNTGLAGMVMAIVVGIGFLLLASYTAISALWAFPILSASFLLTTRYLAVAVSTLALIGIGAQPDAFVSDVERSSFLVTGALVAVFGLIFATRTEMQRDQLAEMARRDPLTGAGNRRALRHRLDSVFERFHRTGEPASLAVLDLDHFKRVNDRHGHDAGDQVLVDLVDIVTSCLRERDRVYRLGGEEFVLVFPATDRAGLETAIRKVHQTLRNELRGPDGPVTVSIGAAELVDADPQHWFLRADQALFRAKEAGRNRIEFDEPES